MLLRFRAANVLSFREELILSMLVHHGSDHARPAGVRGRGKDLAAVTLAAIYGANASGKTNVLAAMMWMASAVTGSVTEWSRHQGVPHRPVFALDPVARGEASLFEVDVVLAGVRHVYGFEVSDTRVESEWLHAYPAGRKQVWFERDAAEPEPYRFPSEWLKGNRQDLARATRGNALFLTVGAQFNHPQLTPVHAWFRDRLRVVTPGVDLAARMAHTVELLADRAFGLRVEELLRAADLGIVGIDVDTTDGTPRIQFAHDGPQGRALLDFERQESLGTQVWFAFLGPMLSALDTGAVVLVDELDSSLHPLLAAEVLRLFRDPAANPLDAQLICTVHDVSLLGSGHVQRPLLRDEVWITEKLRTGESELYPLTDAKPRAEESLERGYLRGRYGGVPKLATSGLAALLNRDLGITT
jgi:hypothetical protein